MGKICSWLFASLLLFSCSNEEKNVAQNIPSQQKTMDSIATQINAARSLQESGQTARALAIADSMLQKVPGQLDAIGIKAAAAARASTHAPRLAIGFDQFGQVRLGQVEVGLREQDRHPIQPDPTRP